MRVDTTTGARPNSRKHKIVFQGSGREYFKIWIVNIFLSILTLGIFSAWAKVRSKRYFYGNTLLDHSSFEYHARPIAILKGRIIAVVFLGIVLLLDTLHPMLQLVTVALIAVLAPWVIWRSLIFNARMSSYRNVRFGFGGRLPALYQYILLLPLLPLLLGGVVIASLQGLGIIDLGALAAEKTANVRLQQETGAILTATVLFAVLATYLIIPYIQKSINSYYFNGHLFGQGKFRARLEAFEYYKIYLKAIGLMLMFLIVFVILIAVIGVFAGLNPRGMMTGYGVSNYPAASGFLGVLFFLPIFAVFVWIKAYTATRFRNYSLSRLKLQSAATFRSQMRVNRLFWIQFSNILLLLLTFGLAWPWAIVRLTRYRLQTIDVRVYGEINSFVTQMQQTQSALGEEIGEAFDLDLDLGI